MKTENGRQLNRDKQRVNISRNAAHVCAAAPRGTRLATRVACAQHINQHRISVCDGMLAPSWRNQSGEESTVYSIIEHA